MYTLVLFLTLVGGVRYPTLEPDYVLRLSSNLASSDAADDAVFVDAVASTHWTRFLNHAQHANVAYALQLTQPPAAPTVRNAALASRASLASLAANGESGAGAGSDAPATTEAVFRTVRAVAAGEELAFDYGVEFWDGRSGGNHPMHNL